MKTRRGFLGSLAMFLPSILAAQITAKKVTTHKFYVTGLFHTDKFNDCTLPVIEVWGTDRLDAFHHLRCTVWTEEEWADANKSWGGDFQQSLGCKEVQQNG